MNDHVVSSEPTSTEVDAALVERLERLAARRAASGGPAPMPSAPVVPGPTAPAAAQVDEALAERVAMLAARRAAAGAPQPGPSQPDRTAAPTTGQRRRRHAARKSRAAALALSLASTCGLTTWFAVTGAATASTVSATGGIVSSAPTAATTTVNGDVFTNKWGPVQVQVAFASDGSISSVDAIQTPFRDGKSVRINDSAVPRLNRETLQAQDAQIDTVSGATYTSTDYRRSLQSAIDTARAAGITAIA